MLSVGRCWRSYRASTGGRSHYNNTLTRIMDIHYTITPDDMLAFNQYFYRHSKEGRVTFLVTYLLAPCIPFLIAVPHLLNPRPDSLPLVVGLVLAGILMLVFFPRYLRHTMRANFQKQLGGSESATHVFRLDDHGIAISAPTGSTAFHWPTIREIVTTDEHIFFFYNARCAAILTRRAFESPDQYASFLQLARAYQRAQTPV